MINNRRKVLKGEYKDWVEEEPNVERVLQHFTELLPIILPAKSVFVAIIYAKCWSLLTNINELEFLKLDLLKDDSSFVPYREVDLTKEVSNSTDCEIPPYILFQYCHIYKEVLNQLKRIDWNYTTGTVPYTLKYFREEFSITDEEMEIIKNGLGKV